MLKTPISLKLFLILLLFFPLHVTRYTLHDNLYAQGMAEEDEFSVAYGLYERGLYELALTRLQAFRDSHPASSRTDDVEFLTGECYFNTARFKEALVRYGMVRSKQYEEILLLRTGQVYFFQDEYDRAILKLQEVITNFPKGKAADAALFFLGESYYKKNDFLSATGIYTILIKEYPVSSYLDQCYYSLAYCRFRRGDLKDALASLEKILKDLDKDPVLSLLRFTNVLAGRITEPVTEEKDEGFGEFVKENLYLFLLWFLVISLIVFLIQQKKHQLLMMLLKAQV